MKRNAIYVGLISILTSQLLMGQTVPDLTNAVTMRQYKVTETTSYFLESADDPSEIHPFDWVKMQNTSESKIVTEWIDHQGYVNSHLHLYDSEGIYEDWMTPTTFILSDKDGVYAFDQFGNEMSFTIKENPEQSNITNYSLFFSQVAFDFPNAQQIQTLNDSGIVVNLQANHYTMSYPPYLTAIYPSAKVIVEKEYDSLNVLVSTVFSKYTALSSGEIVLERQSSRRLEPLLNGQSAIRIINRLYSEYVFNDFGSQKNSESQFDCKIYPNPSSESLTVEVTEEIGEIQFYSMHGAIVKPEVKYQGSHRAEYRVENLKPGIYFVKVKFSNGNSQVIKFVKQ
jgi:hypothetical protein